MSLDLLFAGMDGDIKINNTVAAPAGDTGVSSDIDTDTDDTEQSADIAEGIADAQAGAKDTEAEAQMILRMLNMYSHVRRYGIDRTFVSLYNRHGELNKLCGIQFPACESFSRDGNRYSQYSTAFIAAMEDDDKGLWAQIKKLAKQIIDFIVTQAKKLWDKIATLLNLKRSKLEKLLARLKKLKGDQKVGVLNKVDGLGILTGDALHKFTEANKTYITKADAFTKSVSDLEQKLKTFISNMQNEDHKADITALDEALHKVNDSSAELSQSSISFPKLSLSSDTNGNTTALTINDVVNKVSKFCESSKGMDKSLEDIKKSLEDSSKKYDADINSYSSKAGYETTEATKGPILTALRNIRDAVTDNNVVKSRHLSATSSLEKLLESIIKVASKDDTKTAGSNSSSSTESFDLAFL